MATNQYQMIEGRIQTYISADIDRMYERDFLAGQTNTARGGTQKETGLLKEEWTWVAPRLHRYYGYDPVIVRFYEDIIMQLQRELARYKAMVLELLHSPSRETDVQYSLGEPVRMPPAVLRKMHSLPQPGLPMTGYEIQCMFAQKTDPTTLRQGDIITDVVFPLARMDSPTLLLGIHKEGTGENVTLAGKTEQIGKSHYLVGQIHVVSGLCAVLSQCCDVDSKQDPPPPSLLLCRVLQVPEGLRRSKHFGALKANVDPYGTERPQYRLFYLGNLPDLPDEYLADYGLCMTVAWRDYNHVLRRKILEMDDLTRAKFRVKAGAYFGRPTSEEITAGTADPWHTSP